MNDVMVIVLSEVTVIFLTLFLVNFLMGGLPLKYLAVKASRGKKTLVRVEAVTTTFYKTGIISEGVLEYKASSGKKILSVKRGQVFRYMGVNCIVVDDVKNAVVDPVSFEAVKGFDPIITDNLINRALTRPSMDDTKLKIVLLLTLVIVAVSVIGIVLAWKLNDDVMTRIGGLESQVASLKTMVAEGFKNTQGVV